MPNRSANADQKVAQRSSCEGVMNLPYFGTRDSLSDFPAWSKLNWLKNHKEPP